jgi:amino acid transporter
LYGIRLVSLVNNFGVYAEIVGVLILIVALSAIWFAAGAIDSDNLFRSVNALSQNSPGFSGFALSLLLGAWCLTGFEAAADLAEETQSPRAHVPRAVILSQVSAALAGFLILSLLVLSAGNINQQQTNSNALISILESTLGTRITAFSSIIVIISIFACAVASMATATRLLFSMARDNMLPFSSSMSKVNENRQTPQVATLVIWVFSTLIILMFRRIEIITSVGALTAYLGYSGIMLSTIITTKKLKESPGFTLGKWRMPIQVISLVWTLLVVAALSIPETDIPEIRMKHFPILMATLAAFTGILFYLFYVRNRIKKGVAGPPEIQVIN